MNVPINASWTRLLLLGRATVSRQPVKSLRLSAPRCQALSSSFHPSRTARQHSSAHSMATALEGVKGQSGRDYSVERVLQQKEGLVRGVYLAA